MFKNRPNKCYETKDGPIWHSRSVAVIGIVVVEVKEQKYVLLTKRSELMEDMPGRWCLPCGYLDWDETIEQATEREIYEETHLNVWDLLGLQVKSQFYVNSIPRSNRQNVSIASAFLATLDQLPEIKVTPEVSEVEWCKFIQRELIQKDLVFQHFPLLIGAVDIIF